MPEKFRIHSYGAYQGEFCELLVNVSFHLYSFLSVVIISLSKFDDLVNHAYGNRPRKCA
jgi:hypothetical protein